MSNNVKQLTQRIQESVLMLTSIAFGAVFCLLANQAHIFLYGFGLFGEFSVLFSLIFGLVSGFCYYNCALYDYRKEYQFFAVLKHLTLMHILCFAALMFLEIFAMFHFFPIALIGLSMLGSLFVVYNLFCDGWGHYGQLVPRSLIEQFLGTLFVGALAFAYSNLCVYGFGIVLGFDLSIFAFTLCAMLAWLMLNCFGVELLSLQQQLFVGGLVFAIGAATLCICQLHLPICSLYLVPALNYYILSGWLTDEKQVKNLDYEINKQPYSADDLNKPIPVRKKSIFERRSSKRNPNSDEDNSQTSHSFKGTYS